MLSSLPLIYPRDAHSLWYHPVNSLSLAPNNVPTDPLSAVHPHIPPPQADTTFSGPILPIAPKRTTLSPLAQLEQDERELAARKLSIQRFGATWIRPPGVPKTYQMFLEEEAEREDELAEETAAEGGFLEMEEMEEDADEGAQVDLDAEVPEGEEFLGSDVEEEDSLDDEDAFDLDGAEGLSEIEDGGEQDLDLDAEVPEAEADTLWGDDSSDDFESGSDDDDDVGDILATPGMGNRPMVSSTPYTQTRENERGNRLSLSPGPTPSRPFGRRAQQYSHRYQSSSPGNQIPSSSPQQLLFSHDARLRGDQSFVGSLGFSRRRVSGNQAHSDDDEMEVDF